jgi:purine-binding chemotaxis protein CheW
MSNLVVRVAAAGESYALPVDEVLEVAEFEGVTAVPGSAPAVLGVRNLRGAVLPVVDLAGVLGLPRAGAPERIVVAAEGGRTAGLAVDSVAGVEALPDASEPTDSPYLGGAALTDGALVGLVDLGAVLDAAQGAAAA